MGPPSLDQVVGHGEATERFRRTLSKGRLASTYLFVGPDGVGKRTFAAALAKPLLCLRRGDDPLNACGECDSCRLFDAGAHPDLIQIAKPPGKASLPLELFLGRPERRRREGFCHDIALRPSIGDRRVAVIDDADTLGVESANALLKTLEEPPPGSLIVLVGTSLARQLPTIRSRSQVVRFRALSDGEVASVLKALPDSGDALVPGSRGSVAVALAASSDAQQGLAAIKECFAAAVVEPQRLVAVIDEATKAAGAEPAARRQRLRDAIRVGVDHWGGVLRSDTSDHAILAIDALIDAEASIGRNANQGLVVEALAQRLARIHPR